MRILNVYGQTMGHDELWILGNREGLTALRDALNRTLNNKPVDDLTYTSVETEVTDGESFNTIIVCQDKPLQDKAWDDLHLPYVDYNASTELLSHLRWPADLLPDITYAKLIRNKI